RAVLRSCQRRRTSPPHCRWSRTGTWTRRWSPHVWSAYSSARASSPPAHRLPVIPLACTLFHGESGENVQVGGDISPAAAVWRIAHATKQFITQHVVHLE